MYMFERLTIANLYVIDNVQCNILSYYYQKLISIGILYNSSSTHLNVIFKSIITS